MKYRVKRFSKREEQLAHNQKVHADYIKEAIELEKTELGQRVNQKWKKYDDLVKDYAKNTKYTKEDKAEGRKMARENLKNGFGQLTARTHGKYKYPVKERLQNAWNNIKATGDVYKSSKDSARYTRIDNKLHHLSPEKDPESIKQQRLMDKLREKYEPRYVKVDPL